MSPDDSLSGTSPSFTFYSRRLRSPLFHRTHLSQNVLPLPMYVEPIPKEHFSYPLKQTQEFPYTAIFWLLWYFFSSKLHGNLSFSLLAQTTSMLKAATMSKGLQKIQKNLTTAENYFYFLKPGYQTYLPSTMPSSISTIYPLCDS